MLRIEKESAGHTTRLRLSGRIQSTDIDELWAQMDDDAIRIILDLDEVTLVDVEVVRFLSDCEDGGGTCALPSLCARVDYSRAGRRGTDLEARRKIGFSIASILKPISSAGIRSGV
jgi:hypothetical protein